ncbi:uncharacterized protein LOC130992837 [Salvia miltiorrhiza]|uniref:uncharacterized protein LOC130992837 n=1 Tax=Salvia miltiorrhiza TaxID=226208 RepID=UPI0025AC73D8|nr:uncharacterized protein LOC130992837 [Salvia miltiorrhiza]
MELELGLKLTSVTDEFTSDFRIAKDRASPVFVSRETDSMFFLTAHLRGYKRRNIKIDINEDGSLIGIGGEKQVQETVMVGWKVYKKEGEIKGFKKVFRIPQGVILDKIKAKFNNDESTLSITMPKKEKGIRVGTAIEEVEDKPELVRAGSGSLQIADEKSPKAETSNLEMDEKSKARIGENEAVDQAPSNSGEAKPEEEKHQEKPEEEKHQEKPVSAHDFKDGKVDHVEADTCREDEEKQRNTDDVRGITEPKEHEEKDEPDTYKQDLDKRLDKDRVEPSAIEPKEHEEKDEPDTYKQDLDKRLDEDRVEPSAIEPAEEAPEAEPVPVEGDGERPPEKRFKLCLPIVAGSTLLLTFVVFVFQMIRSKNQTSRRRD